MALALAALGVAAPQAAAVNLTARQAADRMGEVLPAAVATSEQSPDLVGGTDVSVSLAGGTFNAVGTSVPVQIPSSPFSPLRLTTPQGALTLTPEGVAATALTGEAATEDGVVFANTAKSTDTLARPTETGLETFTSIRAAEAPDAYTWLVDLPGDEEVRLTPAGGVQILDPTPTLDRAAAGQQPGSPALDAAELGALQTEGLARADSALVDPNASATNQAAASQAGTQNAPAGAVQAAVERGPGEPGPTTVRTCRTSIVDGHKYLVCSEQTPPDTFGAASDPKVADANTGAKTQANANLQAATSAEASSVTTANTAAAQAADARLAQPVVVAEIDPPYSVDAQGREVPTTLDVTGDRVTLKVDHKTAGVAYPVVADPYIQVVKTRVVWRCCEPFSYLQSYVARWEDRWWWHSWWPWNRIFQYSNILNYSGHYWALYSPWGTTYVTYQPPGQLTVPAWVYARWPIYAQRWVTGWRHYLATETYTDWVWVTDDQEADLFDNSEGNVRDDGSAVVYEPLTSGIADTGDVDLSGLADLPLDESSLDDEGLNDDGDPVAHTACAGPLVFLAPACVQGARVAVMACVRNCAKIPRLLRGGGSKAKLQVKHAASRSVRFKTPPASTGRSTWLSKVASRRSDGLRKALGRRPNGNEKGWEAHHVVALRDKRAFVAQRILGKCGIHPDDRRNGIYLRGPQLAGKTGGRYYGPYHRHLQDHYYRNVNVLMQVLSLDGTFCLGARGTLRATKYLLKRNWFPY